MSLHCLNFSNLKSALPLDYIDQGEPLGGHQESSQLTVRMRAISFPLMAPDSVGKEQESDLEPKLNCHSCQTLKFNQLFVTLLRMTAKHRGLRVKIIYNLISYHWIPTRSVTQDVRELIRRDDFSRVMEEIEKS